MIFDERSIYMLKYEKARSKLVEFNISKKDYPRFKLNSDDLTYSTLYVLSKYCEGLIEKRSYKQLKELFDALTNVSHYYDSTVKTQSREPYNKLFLLLGSTAYFLSENFGSAKVLINKIEENKYKNDIMELLYITLYFLLTGKLLKSYIGSKECIKFLNTLENHFQNGESFDSVFSILQEIRKKVYKSSNIISVNYIDLLYGIMIIARHHSAWIFLPEYSKTKVEKWNNYLSKTNSIKLLWPAQKVIFEKGALIGNNLVVPLPTGVGKTKSIEIILRSKFMNEETCVAIIIAPLRALCNEIASDLTVALKDIAIVNQFSDTVQEDFDLELQSNDKYVFICTPEKFSYVLRHEPEFLDSIQLFIFDEAHLFDDDSRGAQYELLVSEITRSKTEATQMILFSAVLSNANQISEWLFNDKNSTIDHMLVKSTEKSIGFFSHDQTIHYYEKDDMTNESFFVPKSINFSSLNLKKGEIKQRTFPEKGKVQDISIYFANKLCNQGATAIYVGQVRSILPTMRRIVEINKRGYDLLINGEPSERIKLSNLFISHYGKDSELSRASKLGAFPHYAGLPNGLKLSIEHALRKGYIHFVVCTSTLAEGVNIPIKYLIFTTFSYGNTIMQIRKIQNLVGRTARSGIHTEGSAIITDFKFYDNRLKQKGGGIYRWNRCKKMFDYDNTEACTSSILSLVSNLKIDYEYCYDGNSLSDYLIENYNNTFCFRDIKNIIKDLYKSSVPENRFKRNSSTIDQKVSQLEHTFESIENYLCYIYNSNQNSEQFYDTVKELVTKTFAYYLGNDRKKKALNEIFYLIAQKVVSNVNAEKSEYFAKSLYGIDISKKILDWVAGNIDNIKANSTEQILDQIVDLFFNLFSDVEKVSKDTLLTILKLWINGETYIDIYNKFQNNELQKGKKVKLVQIEKICSNVLSYKLCFLIGNILDAISGQTDELNEKFELLQKQIKYGVPNQFQILVCEKIFDDRIISMELDKIYGQVFTSYENFRDCIKSNQDQILELLEKYPSYFEYRFRIYVK